MFATFNKARHRKPPRWAAPLLGGVVVFHVALFVGMWVKTIWDIEHLDRPKMSIDLAVAAAPPPPPAPPPGGAKPQDVVIKPKHHTVRELVQPVHIEQQTAPTAEIGDVGSGSGTVIGGTGDDPNTPDIGDPGPPLPPPPPAAPPPQPVNVAPPTLEASRIAGSKLIEPTDTTKLDIQRSGKSRLVGSFKLCLTAGGAVSTVAMLKSSGFPAYDQTIMTRIREEWRYRPFMINGTPAPVCTAVTFIYSQ